MANISAHETTPGHTFSTADFILSTTSNPLAELRFGTAFFSPLKLDVSSRRIDPSHPYHDVHISYIRSKSSSNHIKNKRNRKQIMLGLIISIH
jgi:hypothetical protein